MNYWEECLSIAAEECGLVLTDEQLSYLAEAVEGGRDNYSQAHGYDVIGSPVNTELTKLKQQVKQREDWENSTRPCPECSTTGWVIDSWGRDATCLNCDGKGRIKINW